MPIHRRQETSATSTTSSVAATTPARVAHLGCGSSTVTNIPDKIQLDGEVVTPAQLLFRIREVLCNNLCKAPKGIPDNVFAKIKKGELCEMAIAVKGTDGQDIEATGWSDSSPLGEQTQQCWDGTSRIITECFEKETTPFAPGWINGPNDYQFYQMEFRVLNSRDSRHSLLLGGDNTLKQVTNVTSTTSSLSATKTETSTITLSSTLSTSTSLGDLAPTGDSGSSNKGAIIGGAVGGSLALLLLLGLLFFFLYRRRKSNEPVEIGAGHEKVHLQLHDGVSETNWKNLPEIYTTPAQLPATLNELGHSAELPANTPELEDLDIDR